MKIKNDMTFRLLTSLIFLILMSVNWVGCGHLNQNQNQKQDDLSYSEDIRGRFLASQTVVAGEKKEDLPELKEAYLENDSSLLDPDTDLVFDELDIKDKIEEDNVTILVSSPPVANSVAIAEETVVPKAPTESEDVLDTEVAADTVDVLDIPVVSTEVIVTPTPAATPLAVDLSGLKKTQEEVIKIKGQLAELAKARKISLTASTWRESVLKGKIKKLEDENLLLKSKKEEIKVTRTISATKKDSETQTAETPPTQGKVKVAKALDCAPPTLESLLDERFRQSLLAPLYQMNLLNQLIAAGSIPEFLRAQNVQGGGPLPLGMPAHDPRIYGYGWQDHNPWSNGINYQYPMMSPPPLPFTPVNPSILGMGRGNYERMMAPVNNTYNFYYQNPEQYPMPFSGGMRGDLNYPSDNNGGINFSGRGYQGGFNFN